LSSARIFLFIIKDKIPPREIKTNPLGGCFIDYDVNSCFSIS